MNLDIGGSDFTDLNQLTLLHLQEIDLRGSPVSTLEPLQNIASLRRVIVDQGQFVREQVEDLPPSLLVVFEPPVNE